MNPDLKTIYFFLLEEKTRQIENTSQNNNLLNKRHQHLKQIFTL